MIEFSGQEPRRALLMPWKKCISVGRAYELLRADVLEAVE